MPSALNKLLLFIVFTTAFFSAPYSLFASDNEPSNDLKTEIKEYISHHLEDSYDFSLFSYTNDENEHVYIGIPLPVILWDEGLQIFSSSKQEDYFGQRLKVSASHFKCKVFNKDNRTCMSLK